MLKNILREENDELLKSEINGFKEELESALAAISTLKKFDSDASMRSSVNQIPANFGANILGKVGDRIRKRAGDDTKSGGKGAYGLAVAFAQLATYRDIGLTKMMTLLLQTGKTGKDLAEQYQNVLDHNRDTVYQRHLAFFHTPALAMAQTMVYYYPPGHDKQSNYLYSFIKANGIDEPSTIPTGHYVIKSKYWPAYYLRRSFSSGYKTEISYSPMPFNKKQGRVLYSVSYNADTPTTEDRIRVTKKSNGYYSFKLDDPRYTTHSDYRYVYYNSKDKDVSYVNIVTRPPSNYGEFIIIKYMEPKGTVITISEKDSVSKFWNGLSNRWGVYPTELDESNKKSIPFILLKCETTAGSECPDWKR
ncbi:uncharacterized protein LOC130641939 [Hydractinia symbiolongicarpus]|uniref:uncharacterized protein LOC130641939 n=1 Tax=Hydractinia symbiolongicarpus TaxID=13093 RepID=UPI00254A2CD6|nr:uncharacterized protein LOC130641939 [Hydractinia symbiolongicarpus]